MNLQQMKVRVRNWLTNCFGVEHTNDKSERSFRFAEECVELCQAIGLSRDQMNSILDHVYSRPKGEVDQEAAGTLITLLSVCDLHSVSLESIFKSEMNRAENNIEAIRAKHNTKPAHLAKHISYSQNQEILNRSKIKHVTKKLCDFFNAPISFAFHMGTASSEYFAISVKSISAVIQADPTLLDIRVYKEWREKQPKLFFLDSYTTIERITGIFEGIKLDKKQTKFWVTRIAPNSKDLNNIVELTEALDLDSIGFCLQGIAFPKVVQCEFGSPVPSDNEYLFIFNKQILND